MNLKKENESDVTEESNIKDDLKKENSAQEDFINQIEEENPEEEVASTSDKAQQEEFPDEDDKSYIDQEDNPYFKSQSVQQDLSPEVIDHDFKNIKLYDLYRSLSNYISYFISIYSKLQLDMISTSNYNKLIIIYNNLKKLKEDETFYMVNEFEGNDYNKNLYTYLLFNKSFAENISFFRNILHVTSNTED